MEMESLDFIASGNKLISQLPSHKKYFTQFTDMLVLLRVLSFPMILLGVGIIPIFWNPLKKSIFKKISFLCCTSVLVGCVWIDRDVIFTSNFSNFFVLRIGRFLIMYFVLWWNHNLFYTLTLKLLNLSKRYDTCVSRKQWPLLLSIIVLALSTLSPMFNISQNKFIKDWKQVTFGLVFYIILAKFICFLIPALYIIYTSEFTYLFQQAEYLWKMELQSVFDGKLQNNLQSIRIFHSEISSVISIFENAFGINVLLYHAYVFIDILVTFQYFSDSYENYLQFVTRVFSGSVSILLMIKFTQDMTEASEEIVSNLKSVELENLPNIDQLQVELMLKKVQCCPVTINVCGMFEVNRQLLAEIIMGATTYCNAIVQLRPYIRLIYPEDNMNNVTDSTQ